MTGKWRVFMSMFAIRESSNCAFATNVLDMRIRVTYAWLVLRHFEE